ncbi:MAG: inorganic diphosphatase, partial [Bdellovibrionales bacterium]|nr:inorganic diphosphatase [Bdellovibrionales bacterium]
LLKEIEHFFSIYKDLEKKSVKIIGWKDRAAAENVIEECIERAKT